MSVCLISFKSCQYFLQNLSTREYNQNEVFYFLRNGMKKLLLATLLAGTSSLAFANTFTQDLYVQGSVGASKLEVKFDGEKAKDNNAGFQIAVGKDTGAVRYQADYTNFGKIEERVDYAPDNYDHTEFKVQSLGASAIYDFQTVSGFTPYAGIRLGVNQLEVEWNDSITPNGVVVTDSGSEKKTKVGIGALAGVQYAINQNLALDAGVEYNHLGKVEDVKFNQYGAKVGLRYNF